MNTEHWVHMYAERSEWWFGNAMLISISCVCECMSYLMVKWNYSSLLKRNGINVLVSQFDLQLSLAHFSCLPLKTLFKRAKKSSDFDLSNCLSTYYNRYSIIWLTQANSSSNGTATMAGLAAPVRAHYARCMWSWWWWWWWWHNIKKDDDSSS